MSKSKESTLFNMLMVLLTVTLFAGLSLSIVNEITKEPKAKAKEKQKIKALKLVLPPFDNNPVNEKMMIKQGDTKDSIEVFPAKLNAKNVGKAIIGFSNSGFNGLVKLMVGFDNSGNVYNIVVLEQKETPGLGTKMKDEKFIKQYKNHNPAKTDIRVKKDGGEIDALTGATISTRAFSGAVQMASDIYNGKKSK